MPLAPARFAELDQQRLARLEKLGLEIRTVFDLGASNGAWSRVISEAFPKARFELFEPLAPHAPKYQSVLTQTLAARPNLHLHTCAIGAATGKTTRFMSPDDLVGSTALEVGAASAGSVPVEVEVITVDEAVRRWQLPVPQVIKMETQGYELRALQGAQATLPGVDLLLLKTWLLRGYGKSTPLLHELCEWLLPFNFYIYDFGDEYRDAEGVLASQDVFFLNAASKISHLRHERCRVPRAAGGTRLTLRQRLGRWLGRG